MALLEVSKPIQERFHKLRDDWKAKTRHLSNTAQISLVFPYQMIIGMGPQVVPLILAELERETDHWFWALEAITGENPVTAQEAGDIEASAQAWISLGKAKRPAGKMNLFDLFPQMTDDNHEVTSPKTIKYNCIAWAAKVTDRWWQPGVYWPVESSRDDHGVGNLIAAFKSLGYEECNHGTLENGVEKIAIYGAGLMYTHAARQLPDGRWSSKLGQLEDIVHSTVEAIAGSDYGEVVQFMKRQIRD